MSEPFSAPFSAPFSEPFSAALSDEPTCPLAERGDGSSSSSAAAGRLACGFATSGRVPSSLFSRMYSSISRQPSYTAAFWALGFRA